MKATKYFISFSILALVILSCGCLDNDGKAGLTIAGSTTVQPIVTKAAEVYEGEHPDIRIGVQGGGSGTGIRMAGEGSVAIGASSRELKDAEKTEHPELKVTPIAIDCITIVVHSSNPIRNLSKEHIRDIFAGKITNFAEVGGPDRRIVVVIREDGSGTRSTFEELVMNKNETTNAALQKPASGAIRFTVAGNENAIGYIGIGYVDATIKTVAVDGITPTEENIKAGKYPLSRKLYLLTKGEPTDQAKDFIDFILSDEGQKLVKEEGFISVK
jgi:phosphate transport system substrate-binding protein